MPSWSDAQKAAHQPTWSAAVSHRFVADLWAGTVPDGAMRTYLGQDYLFVDAFVALLGGAVSHADVPAARMRLARQLGLVANDEDGYFVRALRRLGADPTTSTPPAALAPTRTFVATMHEARADYGSALTVLLVAEWLYLDWGTPQPTPPTPPDWLHAEWIDLHRGGWFEDWVAFLRAEADRVAAGADAETRARMEDLFARCVALELAFFDATYPPSGQGDGARE